MLAAENIYIHLFVRLHPWNLMGFAYWKMKLAIWQLSFTYMEHAHTTADSVLKDVLGQAGF